MSNTSGVVEDIAFYKNIVNKLKVADLQNILAYVGKRSNGRKSELQNRVMNMIRSKNSGGMLKTKEIYAQLMAFQQARAPAVTPPPIKDVGAFSVNNYFLPPMSSSSLFGLPVTPPSSAVMESNHMAGAVHPDVQFRKLPFYDLIDVLLRPASLAAPNAPQMQYSRSAALTRQQQYQFYLSPQHLKHLQNKPQQAQIQVRLCKIEPTDQDDAFPNGLVIRVNNKYITLPNFIPSNKQNVPPKRPAEPLNITSKCLFSVSSPTKVFVTWDEEYNSPRYALGIFLVDKLDSADLIHRLKSKAARPAEFTMGYIKEKYNSENDSEIKTLELTSSLICPLGKMRMAFPTKASTCAHLQCFDGATFIKMNELKPKWNCPVCDKPAYYDTLSIDGYFYDIVRASPKSNEIQLRPDGTWSLSSDKEKESSSARSTVDSHRYSPINMSTKDSAPSKTSCDVVDEPDLITLDSESDSNDSEDPAIVSDSVSHLSSKPPKKRFRPDNEQGEEDEVEDLTMCVDLTEDSGDERGGRSRGSAESSGGVASASSEGTVSEAVKTDSSERAPSSQSSSWMGFYGTAGDWQVSTTSDSAPPDSRGDAAPALGDQNDQTPVPKIAAGPPPAEYETLDHVSGEFSNFTRAYSQSYHSKGSTTSTGGGSSVSPPPPSPLPTLSTGSPQVSSSNDVITLDDSLSPPPLPQQPNTVASSLELAESTSAVTSHPELKAQLLLEKPSRETSASVFDPLASSASNSPTHKALLPRTNARTWSESTSESEEKSLASRVRRPLRLTVRGRGRSKAVEPRKRVVWTSSGSSSESSSESQSSEESSDDFHVSDDDEEED